MHDSLGTARQQVFTESCLFNGVLALSPHALQQCLLQKQVYTELHTNFCEVLWITVYYYYFYVLLFYCGNSLIKTC